jgi:hypothetical protein
MRSGSDYAESMTNVLRPRQEFPTPLFRVVVPVLVGLAVALLLYWLVW